MWSVLPRDRKTFLIEPPGFVDGVGEAGVGVIQRIRVEANGVMDGRYEIVRPVLSFVEVDFRSVQDGVGGFVRQLIATISRETEVSGN